MDNIDKVALLLLACARNSTRLFPRNNAREGDWVYETSSISYAFKSNPLDYFGILLRREFHEVSGEPYYWIIKTIDDREVKWGNADFQVIPCAEFLKKDIGML